MPSKKTWAYAVWLLVIGGFAGVHALNLGADFPNHSPWWMDWAKYTDEGWYGNAAVRAHLAGNSSLSSWYLAGDFNPAAAVPVWPLMEWVTFFASGVSIEAARGLVVGVFFANLWLSYLLLRTRAPRWVGMLALTLLVTSPFLYSFGRLATLEPMLTLLTLAAMNVGVRVPRMRSPMVGALGVGVLFTLMMLTKTTAIFLLPAVVWPVIAPRRREWDKRWRCVGGAAVTFIGGYGLWMAGIVKAGLFGDYRYLFFINDYVKPKEIYWPLLSLWWCIHGGVWADRILVPLAGIVALLAVGMWWGKRDRGEAEWEEAKSGKSSRNRGGHGLLLDPVFGASLLAVVGYVLFMTYQNHPQPRYYSVVGWFCFLMVAQGAGSLLVQADGVMRREVWQRPFGWSVIAVAAIAAGINGAWTLDYAMHPEYSFVNAAKRLTQYVDEHPNGKRLLLSVSGDQIEMVTHLPTINDLFIGPDKAMPDLAGKLVYYRPGWFACWNALDAGALEDLHTIGSVDQVASFRVFDDPQRNVLVLFKLHAWADGRVRDEGDEDLSSKFPEDKFNVPLQ